MTIQQMLRGFIEVVEGEWSNGAPHWDIVIEAKKWLQDHPEPATPDTEHKPVTGSQL